MKFTNAIIGITFFASIGLLSSGLSQSIWTKAELNILGSLSLNKLGTVPKDPSNAVADNEQAAELGQKLFFDKRLSANGDVACTTCHNPEKYFADDQALSEGTGMTDRKSPSIVGAAYSQWYFWDGRADSQWSQALGPLESTVEHGSDRTGYARVVFANYKTEYQTLFGELPDLTDSFRFPDHAGPIAGTKAGTTWQYMDTNDRDAVTRVFVNMSKAIAAYERKLNPGRSRFDVFVETLVNPEDDSSVSGTLTNDEMAGLKLFIGKANCVTCHSGPLLTDGQFHNTGVPTAQGLKLDLGRASGLQKLANSEFSCRSKYSDAKAEQCLGSDINSEPYDTTEAQPMNGAFKTPTLRGVTLHAPFMHAGQFANIGKVLKYYNDAPAAPTGKTEIKALGLTDLEMQQLETFLKTLEAPVNADAKWLTDPFSN